MYVCMYVCSIYLYVSIYDEHTSPPPLHPAKDSFWRRSQQIACNFKVPQFCSVTALHFHSSTVLQFYRFTVLQFYSSPVLQFYSFTALQLCSSTILQFCSSTVLPPHSQARRHTAVNLQTQYAKCRKLYGFIFSSKMCVTVPVVHTKAVQCYSCLTEQIHVESRRPCHVAAIRLHVNRHHTWHHGVNL